MKEKIEVLKGMVEDLMRFIPDTAEKEFQIFYQDDLRRGYARREGQRQHPYREGEDSGGEGA